MLQKSAINLILTFSIFFLCLSVWTFIDSIFFFTTFINLEFWHINLFFIFLVLALPVKELVFNEYPKREIGLIQYIYIAGLIVSSLIASALSYWITHSLLHQVIFTLSPSIWFIIAGIIIINNFILYKTHHFFIAIVYILTGCFTFTIASILQPFILLHFLGNLYQLYTLTLFGIFFIFCQIVITFILRRFLFKPSYLLFLTGKHTGKKFYLLPEGHNKTNSRFLNQTIYSLGSATDNNICLASYHNTNLYHAKIVYTLEGFFLIDYDLFKRTSINFRNIKQQRLSHGSIIQLGDALIQYCNPTA